MELFIQIKNGQPFEHPILGDNFRQAFPHIDVNNLPPEFARFERVPCPNEATKYQANEVKYEWVNGVVKDVWFVRDLTDEEYAQKLEFAKREVEWKIAARKQATQVFINEAVNPKIKQIWIDHLAELNAWVLDDPFFPNFPRPPLIVDENTVYTIHDSGSVPNVIE